MLKVDDGALLAGAADGQLSRAARTTGGGHDLLAELIEASRTGSGDNAGDIGGFHLAPWRWGWRWAGGAWFKPQRVGIERQQTGFLSGGVAELKTEFDGGDLRGRPGQQMLGH